MAVQLNCFGTVHVSVGSSLIKKFRSEKVQALFIYLAIEADVVHTRQSLATLLWPDYDEEAARNNLRVAFYRLQLMFRQYDAALAKQLFVAKRRSIQANLLSGKWLIDVAQLQAHITAVSTHIHTSLATCSTCELHLKEAVTLYRGDFLASFPVGLAEPFDEWVQVTRTQLRHQTAPTLFCRFCNIASS